MTIYLNDLGIICSIGKTKSGIWSALVNGAPNSLQPNSHYLLSGNDRFVGCVDISFENMPQDFKQYNNRTNLMLLNAFKQISETYQKLSSNVSKKRIGVVLGSSTSAMEEAEIAFSEYLDSGGFSESYDFTQQEINSGADFLYHFLNLESDCYYTISTACSSSAKAIIAAKRLIENGICDLVLAGGADSLCKLTVNGFDALESLSKYICAPFSSARDGINIGEGAALFIVSKQSSEVVINGGGESSDAYHMSAPDPSAEGAKHAINQALKEAGISAGDVDYINLHGTATQQNDSMEYEAIKNVFPKGIQASSTKHLTGHMLGAAGACEIGFCWLALSHYNDKGDLPRHQSDDISTNFSHIHFIGQGSNIENRPSYCMSNSFAFGGSNVSIVLSKWSANDLS